MSSSQLSESLTAAKRLLQIEAESVSALSKRIDGAFEQTVKLLTGLRGHVVVSGVGKSGHIARKISATLSSTGTPSTFLHPAEAAHGDLGIVTRDDAALLISKSGESEEIWRLLPYLKFLGVPIIGMLGDTACVLASKCDIVLDASVQEEGCPMNLAPTASTTAALALGDALAVALLTAKGFKTEDFAFLHPGGALGRRLALRISDVMHEGENVPVIAADADLKQAIVVMTKKRLGAVCVTDSSNHLLGIFTDGDLRRAWERNIVLDSARVGEVATKNPKHTTPDQLVSGAINLMERHNILVLPVLESDNTLVGIVHMHDLLKSGIGKP
jgi:arabinose-5-phosphate isomerase